MEDKQARTHKKRTNNEFRNGKAAAAAIIKNGKLTELPFVIVRALIFQTFQMFIKLFACFLCSLPFS